MESSESKFSRRKLIRGAFAIPGFALLSCSRLFADRLNIRNRYSPKNRKRPRRPHTYYLVLHTTEGQEAGSLKKIWNRGEAHYFVNKKGRVYRIIHKSKIATHAGRSMWEGRGPIDNYSIGIEVVGYHDREPTPAQYEALKELLRQLKALFDVPDERIITHSMVAYGRPNRFHPYKHRGRKRCGMIFARSDVRKRLGINGKPVTDPDVKAGRLRIADRELFAYLYRRDFMATADISSPRPDTPGEYIITRNRPAWAIARDHYDRPETRYIFPDGRQLAGNEIKDWGKMPAGTRVIVSEVAESNGFEGFYEVRSPESARDIVGDAFDDDTTIYFLPSGLVRTGFEMARQQSTRKILDRLPKGSRVLIGYVYGGHIKRNRTASRIAGRKWNYPSTFYRLPDGRILNGDEIDDRNLPRNTLVLFQS